MDEFELIAVTLIAEGTMIGPDVTRQLPHAQVKRRTHEREGRTTLFAVPEDVPAIFPSNADLGAELVIAGVGQAQASLLVREGRLRALVVAVPPEAWPSTPGIIGRVDAEDA